MIITEVTHYFFKKKHKNTKRKHKKHKKHKKKKKKIEKTFFLNIFLYFFFLQKTVN